VTADLLKFALEDARSAAVRVQLAIEQEPATTPAGIKLVRLQLAAQDLRSAIVILERSIAAE
jgi:hypothetical protein